MPSDLPWELFLALEHAKDIGVSILLVEQNAKRSLAIASAAYRPEVAHRCGSVAHGGRRMGTDPAADFLRDRLIGTWRMLSWKRVLADSPDESDALGPDPFGYINYAPDG